MCMAACFFLGLGFVMCFDLFVLCFFCRVHLERLSISDRVFPVAPDTLNLNGDFAQFGVSLWLHCFFS